MASTEALDRSRRSTPTEMRGGVAAVDRGRLEPERRRLALHAGRRPRLRLRGADGKWEASSLVLPLGHKLAWISMVLVTKARRRGGARHRPAEALHRRGAGERRGRRPRCDGAGTADLPAARLSRSLHDLALAFRRGEGRRHSAAGIAVRPIDGGRPAEAAALYDRPLSGMERPALLTHLALRQPGRAWIAEDAAGTTRRLRAGPRGPDRRPRIGPVVADNEATGLALIAKAAASAPGPFIIDVPERASRSPRVARAAGRASARAATCA